MSTDDPRATLLLATPGRGINRAERSGGHWSVTHLLEAHRVRCLAAEGGVFWAGTHGAGVWRSEDGGRGWRPAGLEGRVVTALAPSPDDPARVYAGLKPAAVAVTRDGGSAWTELDGFRRIRGRWLWFSPAEPPGSPYVQGLAVAPGDPDLVVAGMEFGAVVRTTDGGRTWSGHRKGAIRDCHSLTFHATDGSRVYEGGAGFPRRPCAASRDAGATWTSPGGNRLGYGWACAADPADPDTMYCSAASGPGRAHGSRSADAHLYRSTGGGPWVRLTGGLPDPLGAMPYALITDPSAPGHLYAGLADGRLFFTADSGDRWIRLDLDLGRIERDVIMSA